MPASMLSPAPTVLICRDRDRRTAVGLLCGYQERASGAEHSPTAATHLIEAVRSNAVLH